MNRRLIFPYFLFLLSLILFFWAGSSYQTTKLFIESSIITTGTVDGYKEKMADGSIMYSPKISFEDKDGKTIHFVSDVESDSKRYDIKDKVQVLYKYNNPHKAKINSFMTLWFSTIVYLLMAICAIIPITSILTRIVFRKRTSNRLSKTGTTVLANVSDISKSKISTGNARQYIIKAKWQHHNGQTHTFKSYGVWQDPAEYIKIGDNVSVLVDMKKPKKYIMDTSFIPNNK